MAAASRARPRWSRGTPPCGPCTRDGLFALSSTPTDAKGWRPQDWRSSRNCIARHSQTLEARNPQLREANTKLAIRPGLAGRRCRQPHAWIAIEARASDDQYMTAARDEEGGGGPDGREALSCV